MDLTEKKMESQQLYGGKIVKLFRDTVELPNGKTALREVVRHPGVGCIMLMAGLFFCSCLLYA